MEKSWHGRCLINSSTYYSEHTQNLYCCPEANLITSLNFSSLLSAKGTECIEYTYSVFTARTTEHHRWCRQEENHVGALMPAVALLNAAQDPGKTATEMLAGPARLTSACKDLADVAYFSLSRLESLSTEQDTLSSSNKECQGLAGWVFFLQKSRQFCTVKKLCIVNEQHTWEPGGETSTRIHLVLRCSKMHFPSLGKAKWEGVNLPYLFCHCPNLENSKLAAAQWSSQCNFPPDYSKLGMGVFPNLLLLWFHNKLAPCTITKIALLSALQA